MNAVFRHSAAALGAALGAPVALGALLVRPRWRVGLTERLGGGTRPEAGAVWVHGASVGEILAGLRLIDVLSARGHRVLASTTTATGRAVLRRAHAGTPARLAPIDHPWCVAASLTRVRPSALVLVETELWPSWIAAATRRGVPVLVVSGRLSERSLSRYRRFLPVLRATFARLAAVGARTPNDAARFISLGVPKDRVSVTGDLKLEPPRPPPPLASELRTALGEGEPLVAASTHPGEEETLLRALEAAGPSRLAAPVVLAPRHPDRSTDVAALARARGWKVQLRSRLASGTRLAGGEVLVLDTLGELPALLPRAALVFVGGSLVPRGGHNVVEPAQAGRAVIFGPHTESVREAARALVACEGARQVADAAELGRVFQELLADPEARRRLGERARAEVARHRGAAGRSADLVEAVLAATRERA